MVNVLWRALLAVALVFVTPAPTTLGATDTCVPAVDSHRSVARVWDEALLDAIRRDIPRPTVHARNLFHVSAGMWDAWAAYDPVARGTFVDEDHQATDVVAARDEAISYAAYRILTERYANAEGAEESLAEFDATMAALCYASDVIATAGDSPAALGNRIAATIIEFGLSDGSLEQADYTSDDYRPVNPPLIVKRPGTVMKDPNRWQPLALDTFVTQNDIVLPAGVQTNIGPHWGHVAAFALPATDSGLPMDPGKPPQLGNRRTDDEYKAGAVEVIHFSSYMDPADGVMVDISPGTIGNNPLGTNDGEGYPVNPVTGQPYAPNVVLRADFARVLAEFWADGPSSETPPGHWNTIANAVADSPGFVPRIGGTGPQVDRLEWDVKTYLALNGALHDAAIAAWGCKGHYDTVRPISMVRYLGQRGQSTSRSLPSYDPEGLPLVPGLIEVVTRWSSAPGHRHAALRRHVGEIAIKAWRGNPKDPTTQTGGVGWILAKRWVPYQKDTFVTPAFAAYTSGHSTFSRAAAEVLTAMTGSRFFPGGLGEWPIEAGSLAFEAGATTDVDLQWATYYDAADQAGISRLYGGIHISADDLRGRVMGSQCGKEAWVLATRYFDGTAPTAN